MHFIRGLYVKQIKFIYNDDFILPQMIPVTMLKCKIKLGLGKRVQLCRKVGSKEESEVAGFFIFSQ